MGCRQCSKLSEVIITNSTPIFERSHFEINYADGSYSGSTCTDVTFDYSFKLSKVENGVRFPVRWLLKAKLTRF